MIALFSASVAGVTKVFITTAVAPWKIKGQNKLFQYWVLLQDLKSWMADFEDGQRIGIHPNLRSMHP